MDQNEPTSHLALAKWDHINRPIVSLHAQWRRQLDRLGGHIHTVYSCSAQLISFEIEYMNMSPPPIELATPLFMRILFIFL